MAVVLQDSSDKYTTACNISTTFIILYPSSMGNKVITFIRNANVHREKQVILFSRQIFNTIFRDTANRVVGKKKIHSLIYKCKKQQLQLVFIKMYLRSVTVKAVQGLLIVRRKKKRFYFLFVPIKFAIYSRINSPTYDNCQPYLVSIIAQSKQTKKKKKYGEPRVTRKEFLKQY